MMSMLDKLKGGDLRSIGRSNEIVAEIEENPLLIEEIFPGLHDHDPVLKARAADVLEKATREKPELLLDHKRELISILKKEKQQEVCWHIAQMIPRLEYTPLEEEVVIHALNHYLSNKSKIVRASALEALADLAQRNKSITEEVTKTIRFHTQTGSPAVQARGRKLLKLLKL
jgi:HEAT repeat protein